jgi:hypothetical protein
MLIINNMLIINKTIFQSKTILVKPTLVNIITRNMGKGMDPDKIKEITKKVVEAFQIARSRALVVYQPKYTALAVYQPRATDIVPYRPISARIRRDPESIIEIFNRFPPRFQPLISHRIMPNFTQYERWSQMLEFLLQQLIEHMRNRKDTDTTNTPNKNPSDNSQDNNTSQYEPHEVAIPSYRLNMERLGLLTPNTSTSTAVVPYISTSTVLVPNIPTSTITSSDYIDYIQRVLNSPYMITYINAIFHRFPPRDPEVVSIESLLQRGLEYVNQYFSTIQFESQEFGSSFYQYIMEGFQQFRNLVFSMLTPPAPTSITSTPTSTSSTSTCTTTTTSTTTSTEIDPNEPPVTSDNKPTPSSNNVKPKFDPNKLSEKELVFYRDNVKRILSEATYNTERQDMDLSEGNLKFIKDYQKVIKDSATPESYRCDENIFKQINELMFQYAPSRESISPKPTRNQEEYAMLSHYPISDQVRELLAQERRERYFLTEDYIYNIDRDKKMIEILLNEYQSLPGPVLMELLRGAGILVNNDAQSYELIGGVVEEGEGHKLFKRANEISKELTEDTGERLDDADYAVVMENIKQGNIVERILDREEQLLRLNAEILTGHDLHILILVQDPKDNDSYLCVAMMTSADDEGTVLLGDTQSYDGKEISKKQFVRPVTQVTRIPKDQVEKNDKVELPKKQIIDAILKKEEEKKVPSFKDANILKPIVLDKDKLTQIAIRFVEERIATTQKTLNEKLIELKQLNEKKREKFLDNKRLESEKYKKDQIEEAKDKNLPRKLRGIRKLQKLLGENIVIAKEEKVKIEESEEKTLKVKEEKAKAKLKAEAKAKTQAEEKTQDKDKATDKKSAKFKVKNSKLNNNDSKDSKDKDSNDTKLTK